jgi:hypothetical protein
MLQAATCAPFVSRARRPLFFAVTTRHVKSSELLRELGRAIVALTALVAWGMVMLLVGG